MYHNKVKDYINSQVDVNQLKENCLNTYSSVSHLVDEEDGQKTVFVTTLVSGNYGHYQMEEVAKLFNIDYDIDDVEKLDDIVTKVDSFTNELATQLNQLLNIEGKVYFGHLDADGSYGMFYTVDI